MNPKSIQLLLYISAPVALLLATSNAAAQDTSPPKTEAWRLRAPLLDVPYLTQDGPRAPSMQQALAITSASLELPIDGLGRLATLIAGDTPWLEETLAWTFAGAWTALAAGLPGGIVWLHEEGHRAVLGARGIDTQNGLYRFDSEGVVSVYGVADQDLQQLKRDRPADLVRLAMAGDEQLIVLGQRLTHDAFFFGGSRGELGPVRFSDRRHASVHALLWFLHFAYLQEVLSGDLDKEIDARSPLEATEQERDLLGPDFTAWVRDLHRPEEAYSARGPHPTTRGIQRYTRLSDLTSAERSYLEQQTALHLLNLLNPALFNIQGFALDDETRATAAVVHQLAPFGYNVGLQARLQRGELRLEGAAQGFFAAESVTPGLELALVAWPLQIGPLRTAWTPRLSAWLQPEELLFRAPSRPGGALSLEVELPLLSWLNLHQQLRAKTEGWVAGWEYTTATWSATTSLVATLPR